MKTPAIIASLTVAGSIAFAAGQQSGGKQSPPMPSGAQAHSMQEEMPQTRFREAMSVCGEELQWLNPQFKPLDSCGNTSEWGIPWLTMQPMSGTPTDVNHDGTLDYFWYTPVNLLQDAASYPLCVLSRSRIEQVDGVATERLDCVIRLTSEFVSTTIPPKAYQAQLSSFAWRDMDSDGDSDLVVEFRWQDATGWHYKRGWFENIGFEKPAPPVAADLNGDGQVNGADLGLLLVAWGPNP